ncbi:MAG TPA: hypothetical protein VFT39_15970 [Vicinamibacterales bacterium]|nr:hypothetical protein [Vicinamibacterales bacterium]
MVARSNLRPLLSGGDRRSIAQSNRAYQLVRAHPARIDELAALAADDDWLVSMRALDLLEKIAHEQPKLVHRHKRLFLGPHAESDKWEIRLQIVRALPLLQLTARERKRAIEILRRNVAYPQTFVRAWALDSLAAFAESDRRLMRMVKPLVAQFERSESKALQARARNIRARLEALR